MYFVYILECTNKALYTGITTNIEKRLARHQAGDGCHYTSYNRGVRILYHEIYHNRSEATKREIQIKRWSRGKKLALIKGDKKALKLAAKRRKR